MLQPSTSSTDLAHQLRSGYAELSQVDEALRQAEEKLRAAHGHVAKGQAARTEALYREVLSLRQQSRVVLDGLADMWLAEG
jgi:hypothetical protein